MLTVNPAFEPTQIRPEAAAELVIVEEFLEIAGIQNGDSSPLERPPFLDQLDISSGMIQDITLVPLPKTTT